MQRAVVMVSKAPGVDACKTRLVPPLTGPAANALQVALIQDIWMQMAPASHYDCWIATPSLEGLQYFDSLTSHLLVLQGNTLGQRMHHLAETLFARGYDRVVLIGSDMPLMTHALLETAIAHLDTVPCVLGPAEDGGYYLIGLTPAAPNVFDDIPWGTERVLADTLQRLAVAKTPFALMEPHRDIDRWSDVVFYSQAVSARLPHFSRWWLRHGCDANAKA